MFHLLIFGLGSLYSYAHAEPVVFEPSGKWQGDDGPWSTFTVKLGTPPQNLSVLPAPHRNALIVISPEACPPDPQLGDCGGARGGLFDRQHSQSWHGVEARKWDPLETLLTTHVRVNSTPGAGLQPPFGEHPVSPLSRNMYGLDAIESNTKSGRKWKVPDQGVLSLGSMSPFVGMMGLGTNYNGTARYPVSFFDNVRAVSGMKSASWSYTAGDKNKNAPGSLVFGGYDESRLDKSAIVKYAMHRDTQPFSVSIGNITVSDASQPGPQAIELPRSFLAGLDFTTPYLTLPEQICVNLERMLGITWDSVNALYHVSESRHDELVKTKANITFAIIGDLGQQHDFRIPYASLVLEAKFPLIDNTTKYFAVQRAGRKATTFTLGRAFFQEAHMTTVFDDPAGPYIQLAPAIYDPNTPAKIVEIETRGAAKSHSSVNTAAIVGGIIAVVAVLAIVGYLVFARKTHRFPFAAAAAKPRVAEDDDAPRGLSALSKGDDRAASRVSRNESVYYEAMDDLSNAEGSGGPKRSSVVKG